jgi:hypothetical protein
LLRNVQRVDVEVASGVVEKIVVQSDEVFFALLKLWVDLRPAD